MKKRIRKIVRKFTDDLVGCAVNILLGENYSARKKIKKSSTENREGFK